MNPMKVILDKICNKAGDDGVVAVVIFRSGGVVQGPLRHAKHEDERVDDLYQVMAPAQQGQGPGAKVFMANNYFSADSVERVVQILDAEQPRVITPPGAGGIVVPS